MTTTPDLTRLLRQASAGDKGALDRAVALVFGDLRARARKQLHKERPDHTLSPTALVNEAYLRLVGEKEISYQDRNHFFAIAARKMRQILVNHAHQRTAQKRGGGRQRLPLEGSRLAAGKPPLDLNDLVALDEALQSLESGGNVRSRRLAEVVELRLFGGRTTREIAEHLGVATRTVERDLKTATMVLLSRIYGEGFSPGDDSR